MRRLREQDGSALITALLLMTVMLGVGLATMATADEQQSQSRGERERESSFNLTEAALNAQVFQVSRAWPGRSQNAYPALCAPISLTTTACPDAGSLATSYAGPDYSTASCPAGTPDVPWTTSVRDNGGGAEQYYSRAIADAQPAWDANRDNALWVRAQGVARCRVRTLVTMVRLGLRPAPFPRTALRASWLQTTNQGKKVIVDTLGQYAQPPLVPPPSNDQPGTVELRCDPAVQSPCDAYDRAKGQVAPDTVTTKAGGSAKAIPQAQLDAFKARAQALGTYYTTCPPSASGLAGEVVYIESGTCAYTGNTVVNAADQPGLLIVASGTLELGGTTNFYGVVYLANLGNLSGAALKTNGNARVQGAVTVDGPGGVLAGASGTNIIYDKRVFNSIKTLSGASAVGSTFRELPAGQ